MSVAENRNDWSVNDSSRAKDDFEKDVDDDIIGDLQVTPSTLEVDYDKNLTELYQAITDQDWELAATVCQTNPVQAAIWVVRHYQSENDENSSAAADSGEEAEIMWRFLPLHSACARQPPPATVAALLAAYPDAAKCVDDQGMYALHYACGNQADTAVIRLLITAFTRAAAITDPRGMLPLHYAACWGPSNVSVIDKLLKVNRSAATTRDNDGNTPLDLAMDGDYPQKEAVADAIRKWIRSDTTALDKQKHKHSSVLVAKNQQHQFNKLLTIRQTSSHGSDYNDAIIVDTLEKKQPLEPPALDHHTVRTVLSNASATTTSSSKSRSVTPSAAPTPRLSNNSNSDVQESREAPSSMLAGTPPTMLQSEARRLSLLDSPIKTNETGSGHFDLKTATKNAEILEKNVESLQLKVREQELDLKRTIEELTTARSELEEKTRKVESMDQELKTVKALLEESRTDCSGLRLTLGDIMDQHDNVKRKSGNTHDRLATLSISLDSMMEQQFTMAKIVKDRNENYKATFLKRQELFEQLLEMDKEVEQGEGRLDASLKKQTREMEAIAAVIKAARD